MNLMNSLEKIHIKKSGSSWTRYDVIDVHDVTVVLGSSDIFTPRGVARVLDQGGKFFQ